MLLGFHVVVYIVQTIFNSIAIELWRPFLRLSDCKSNAELAGHQKVVKRMVVQRTGVEGLIIEETLIEKSNQ